VRALVVALAALAGLLVSETAVAQPPAPGGQVFPPRPSAGAPHPDGLDCVACHIDKHRGVQRLYAGTGGRGAPASPDRMFEVGVQCTACHSTPRSPDGARDIAGQNFVVTDQACATCHGDRYRGLVDRWRTGLGSMRETVASKASTVRKALGSGDAKKEAAARRLLDDAEHNVRLVTLAHGAHNAFYAANLLRRADAWVGEAGTLLGQPARTQDALIRGGYCGTLCHEPLGVKLRETVSFRGQPLPHGRHATELGATCTTCHSADAHKKLAATPATCRACHHNPQNERCESCHRDQTAFYRGTLKTTLAPVTPNVMAAAVACTNCHDFSKPQPRAAIKEACAGCHDTTYLPLLTEWTKSGPTQLKAATDAVAAAEQAVATARRAGRGTTAADARIREARDALALVRAGGIAHNPLAAFTLLTRARNAANDAKAAAASR
jgi:hypothetical protein